jgi:hypothetical protein
LDRSTSRDKSIWSNDFVFWEREIKTWSEGKTEKWASGWIWWMSGRHPMLFDITIGVHIESPRSRAKRKSLECQALGATAVQSKTAIFCTSVVSLRASSRCMYACSSMRRTGVIGENITFHGE